LVRKARGLGELAVRILNNLRLILIRRSRRRRACDQIENVLKFGPNGVAHAWCSRGMFMIAGMEQIRGKGIGGYFLGDGNTVATQSPRAPHVNDIQSMLVAEIQIFVSYGTPIFMG
jgi:hypothetical protein